MCMIKNDHEDNYFWTNSDKIKKILCMNPVENIIKENNVKTRNISYLVDNRISLCPHGKLHPLTARNGKYIYA